MDYFRPADSRGHEQASWLDSRHTFSFGHYYDPRHMGLSVLRVINDDTVAPGAGFDTHGHRDMEIISYVMDGAIEHQDSLGNRFVVSAGEVQRMSAGSGIFHSEYNTSSTENLRFLQIWIKPNAQGIKPGYEQAHIEQMDQLTPLVTPDGRSNSLPIHQDTSLYRLRLGAGEAKTLEIGTRQGYLHVISGRAQSETTALQAGDGMGVIVSESLTVVAEEDFEALWFDLP